MGGDQRGDVEIGDDVAVHHDERVVDAGVLGREPDRAGRVERFGLDRVVEPRTAAEAVRERLQERLGLEPERQRHVGDAAFDEAADEPGDHRLVTDRQHRLRDVVRERPHPRAETADEHDRAHQGVDVAVTVVAVVVAAAVVVVTAVAVTVSPSRCRPCGGDAGDRAVRDGAVRDTRVAGDERVVRAGLVRVGRAERDQIGGPRRHRDVGVAWHERDREHHPVAA